MKISADNADIIHHAQRPLTEACSLPFSVYREPTFFTLEQQKIFSDNWVFACVTQELPEIGDYYALTLAGEMIAIIRGEDRKLRAFANICRHRGTPLLDEGFGHVDRNIICPYHAWTYQLTGELKAIPLNKTIAVDKTEHGLIEYPLNSWQGLVFIHLGVPQDRLSTRYADIAPHIAPYELPGFTEQAAGAVEHWQANWKLIMENAMESYHLFKVHRETLEQYTPSRSAYYVAGNAQWSLTGGKTDGAQADKSWGEYGDYLLLMLPPNLVGILSYGSLGWLAVYPQSANTTIVRSGNLAMPGYAQSNTEEQSFTQAFFAEDKAICERVQQGMYSSAACVSPPGKGGKLVEMEQVLVDFHHYWANNLQSELP